MIYSEIIMYPESVFFYAGSHRVALALLCTEGVSHHVDFIKTFEEAEHSDRSWGWGEGN